MDIESKSADAAYSKIKILESRLASIKNKSNDGFASEGLFPSKAVALYYNLLGTAYMELSGIKATSISSSTDIEERCLQAHQSAVNWAADDLEIWDRKFC